MIRPRSEPPFRTRCGVFLRQTGTVQADQAEHVLGFNRKHLNKKISGCSSLSPQMQVCAEKEHKRVSGAWNSFHFVECN